MTEQPDVVGLVERATAATYPIVGGIRPDQWELATPCPEWDVRGVTRHLLDGVASYLAAYGDGPGLASDAVADADLLAAMEAADARLLARLRAPGGREAMLDMGYATVPAEMIAGFRLIDLLVHGWDIARATGQPTDGDPAVYEAALAISRQALDGLARASFGMFAEETTPPAGASAADRLAAFLGRAV